MQMVAEEFKRKASWAGRSSWSSKTTTNPQVGARKARRLIEVDKIKYLTGGVSSSVAVPVGEVAQRYGALFVGSNRVRHLDGTVRPPELLHGPSRYAMALRTLAPYLIEKVGKKWYFLASDSSGMVRNQVGEADPPEVRRHGSGKSKIPLNTRYSVPSF